MYKILNEFHNNNRFTRKQMSKEEKAEYIQKCKDFSLYRVKFTYIESLMEANS